MANPITMESLSQRLVGFVAQSDKEIKEHIIESIIRDTEKARGGTAETHEQRRLFLNRCLVLQAQNNFELRPGEKTSARFATLLGLYGDLFTSEKKSSMLNQAMGKDEKFKTLVMNAIDCARGADSEAKNLDKKVEDEIAKGRENGTITGPSKRSYWTGHRRIEIS